MITIPMWLLFTLCCGVFILFFMIRDVNRKLTALQMKDQENTITINNSFREIANDMRDITIAIEKYEANKKH